jgi:hypothetical protein
MNWTFKNKRSVKPSDDEIRAADDDRMRRRVDLRLEIARMELLRQKAGLLQQEVDAINARCDAAADLHQQTCEPLQQRLEELEQRAIGRIASRSPADETEDAERRELIGSITSANRELETVLQRERALRKPLEQKIVGLTDQFCTVEAIRGRLAQPPFASPTLQIESHVSQQKQKFAAARAAAARQAMKIVEANIDGIQRRIMSGDLSVWLHKRDCWLAEIEAAEADKQAALAEGNSIHQAMIDE